MQTTLHYVNIMDKEAKAGRDPFVWLHSANIHIVSSTHREAFRAQCLVDYNKRQERRVKARYDTWPNRNKKPRPPKKMTEAESRTQAKRNSKAIRGTL